MSVHYLTWTDKLWRCRLRLRPPSSVPCMMFCRGWYAVGCGQKPWHLLTRNYIEVNFLSVPVRDMEEPSHTFVSRTLGSFYLPQPGLSKSHIFSVEWIWPTICRTGICHGRWYYYSIYQWCFQLCSIINKCFKNYLWWISFLRVINPLQVIEIEQGCSDYFWYNNNFLIIPIN